jgi:hypothetical protein
MWILMKKIFCFKNGCIFLLKKGVCNRLSNTGFMIRKKPEFWKASSCDFIFESCPIIESDFVEIDEGRFRDPSLF